ncbi:MAG: winged helix-turn-helix domain-containing protein [Deltaproteobacteria bacterium]|nr:winged helix-turn-helix domain-containing protein [Deltaproteobacteria bacterium]
MSAGKTPKEEDLAGSPPTKARLPYHFADFELRTSPTELFHRGERLELAPQPARLLELLVSQAGRTVRREEIRKAIWGDDVHVDFERGINFNIRQIRSVLGDNPNRPRFIQTVPRQGYCFVAKLEPEKPARPKGLLAAGVVLATLCTLVLALKGSGGRERPLQAPPQEDLSELSPAALDHYQIARRLLQSDDSIDREKALGAFGATLASSPDFAPAHAGLAKAHSTLFEVPEAQRAAKDALALDPESVEAHLVLVETSMHQNLQAEEHLRTLERVWAVSPDNYEALQLGTLLLASQGETAAAVKMSFRFQEKDPLAWIGRWTVAWALFQDRQYEAAATQIRATTQLYPRHAATPYHLLIHSLIRLGRSEEALQAANLYLSSQDWATDEAKTIDDWWRLFLDGFGEIGDRPGSQQRSQKAILHIGLGETAEALALLQDACEKHTVWDLRFLRVDPRYDSLRLEPEFQEILRCLNSAPPEGAPIEGSLGTSEVDS